MLPKELYQESRVYQGGKEWKNYLSSIGEYANLDHEFLSQICYEHYDRFNEYFPRFDIHINRINRIKLTTEEIYNNVKYDRNQEIDFWYSHIDTDISKKWRKPYPILDSILQNGTWQLPPVIIRNELACRLGNMHYGEPFHLIEGTHRVSYLRRWYEKGMVDRYKAHEFLIIE